MPHNCWVITSTINTPHGLIDSDTRHAQTVQTVISIREHDPHAYVILIDNSTQPLVHSQIIQLTKPVNSFVWVGDRSMNKWVNRLGIKGVGECHMLLLALNMIQHSEIKFDRMFKISGRYRLVPGFDPHAHAHTHMWCFKRRHQDPCGTWALHTRLWSVCASLLCEVKHTLRETCVHHVTHNCTMEQALFKCINLTRVTEMDRLYCEGHIAPWNQLIQD